MAASRPSESGFDPPCARYGSAAAWQVAAQQVWQYLREGQDVACEGDVSFYSTFTYLAQTSTPASQPLCSWCQESVHPCGDGGTGVTLTPRQERLVVLPALYTVGELEALLTGRM